MLVSMSNPSMFLVDIFCPAISGSHTPPAVSGAGLLVCVWLVKVRVQSQLYLDHVFS